MYLRVIEFGKSLWVKKAEKRQLDLARRISVETLENMVLL